MKYIFEGVPREVFDGYSFKAAPPIKYKYRDLDKGKNGVFTPQKGKNRELVSALICQKIAEGGTLKDICKEAWTPTPVEFFIWCDKDFNIKEWYNHACKIRTQILVDRLYARAFSDTEAGKDSEKLVKVLRDILIYIKREETSDSASGVIIHSTEVRPKIFEEIKSDERK